MTNTSATGGPLVPEAAPQPQPLEGAALLDIIQETLVGLTGLGSDFVRPRFQAEPPDYPNTGTAWLSFGIISRSSDTFPVLQHQGRVDPDDPAFLGQDNFQRQEDIIVLCSFYDTGSSGQAYGLACQLKDGLSVPQNTEALTADAQIKLAYCGDLLALPSLAKTLWVFRVDLEIRFRRQLNRTYPILNLDSAMVVLQSASHGVSPIGKFAIGKSAIGGIREIDIIIEE